MESGANVATKWNNHEIDLENNCNHAQYGCWWWRKGSKIQFNFFTIDLTHLKEYQVFILLSFKIFSQVKTNHNLTRVCSLLTLRWPSRPFVDFQRQAS